MQKCIVNQGIVRCNIALIEEAQAFEKVYIMGGPHKWVEPRSYEYILKNEEIWNYFMSVGLTNYTVVMKGHNLMLSTKFVNSWYRGKVTIGTMKFIVTPQLIVEET